MSDEPCSTCGSIDRHVWVEGDCILPHRRHSRRLVPGTFVCEPCVERHTTWLREIVDLYATLTDVLLAGSVPDDTAAHKHQKKAPASPSPIRLDAWALLHNQVNDHVNNDDGTVSPAYLGANLPDIPAILTGWAQALYDANDWTATAPNTVTGAAAALTAGAETIAGDPDVDSYDAELRWVRRALRNAHGLTDPHPLGQCLTLDCGGNVWPAAGEQPRCDRCARRYGASDLVRMKLQARITGATA